MVDFPESAHHSYFFLSKREQDLAISRIEADRGDVEAQPFSLTMCLVHFLDPKIYGFCALFFCLNLVSTSLSYFLPIILQSGMGFSEDRSILLAAPQYFWAVIPVMVSSFVSDKYQLRGPTIVFNCLCVIVGFCMLGFSSQNSVRYAGTFLGTGGYIGNWAAMNAYQANNIVGQWKRATFAAAVSACNGLGGIAGAFIVRNNEAPKYMTAVWVSIGSHLIIMIIVGLFSLHFWERNGKQKRGLAKLEGTEGFLYTY